MMTFLVLKLKTLDLHGKKIKLEVFGFQFFGVFSLSKLKSWNTLFILFG